jgi:hypothetical protein
MAQTLTCTFQFTGSGSLGTQTFTNAAITVTTVGNTANRQVSTIESYLINDSASIVISGVGTFQFTVPIVTEAINQTPNVPGALVNEEFRFGISGQYLVGGTTHVSDLWTMLNSFGPITIPAGYITGWKYQPITTGGGVLNLYDANPQVTFQSTLTGAPPPPTTPPPANQTPVAFTYQIGGAVPSSILESVTTPYAPLNLTLSTNGGSWLLASLSSTVTPAILTISVNPTGLVVGTYTGNVAVAATGSNTITFIVTLTVTAPPLPTGQFVVSPASLTFTTPINGTPFPQSFTVNSNGGIILYQASSNVQWLTVIGNGTPTSNGWSGTTPGSISVFASSSGLLAGTYNGTITITAPSASNSPQTVPVSLTVTSSPTISISST